MRCSVCLDRRHERWRWDHYARYQNRPSNRKSGMAIRQYDRPHYGGGEGVQRIVTRFGGTSFVWRTRCEAKLLWCNRSRIMCDGSSRVIVAGGGVYNRMAPDNHLARRGS